MGVQASEADLQTIAQEADAENAATGAAGGTGVSFPIFHGFVQKKLKEVSREESTKEAFKHLEDGAGFISLSELRYMIATNSTEKISDEELDALLASADADKDGKITLAEFEKMLTPPPA
jgi:Ca2+-binding EF-hand superfamily protein